MIFNVAMFEVALKHQLNLFQWDMMLALGSISLFLGKIVEIGIFHVEKAACNYVCIIYRTVNNIPFA